MDFPTPNTAPAPTNSLKTKILGSLSKIKKPQVAIVLVLTIMSLSSIGVIVNNEMAKRASKAQNQNQAGDAIVGIEEAPPTVEGVAPVPIWSEDGGVEYYTYMPNGTLIDWQDSSNSTYKEPDTSDPNYVPPLDEAVKKAIANPGTLQCGISGGATQTCIIADANGKTYSETAYKQAFPPTTAPVAATAAPSSTNSTSPSTQKSTVDVTKPSISPSPSPVICDKLHGSITCNGFGLSCYWDGDSCEKKASPLTPSPTKAIKQVNCSTLDSSIECNGFGISCAWSGSSCESKSNQKTTNSTTTPEPTISLPYKPVFSPTKNIVQLPINTTSAPEPTEARANLIVETAGIGTNTSLGQNPIPVRPQFMQIQVLDNNDEVLKEGILPLYAKEVSLQTTTNIGFSELLSLGSLPAGNYKTRMRLDNTLWKAVSATFTPGTETSLSPIKLTAGDIDQDNLISLNDYNLLISCLQQTCSRKSQADLNLDGIIDEIDLNILYSTFSTRLGD